MFEEGLKRILISEDDIRQIVKKLGKQITEDYRDIEDELIVIGLLRGSFVFMADLVREIRIKMVTDFMTVSSYTDKTESSGDVKIIMDLDESINGKHILMVEDIIDTGNTFNKVLKLLNSRNPESLKICALLSKPSRRVKDVSIDYCGMEIPDEFVCGYGLDYAQKYRNLPYIGILDPEYR